MESEGIPGTQEVIGCRLWNNHLVKALDMEFCDARILGFCIMQLQR